MIGVCICLAIWVTVMVLVEKRTEQKVHGMPVIHSPGSSGNVSVVQEAVESGKGDSKV